VNYSIFNSLWPGLKDIIGFGKRRHKCTFVITRAHVRWLSSFGDLAFIVSMIILLVFAFLIQFSSSFDLKLLTKLFKEEKKDPVGGGAACVVCTISVSIIEQMALVRNQTVGMLFLLHQ
jgi:hypothetical protein